MEAKHESVLVDEVMETLAVRPNDTVVDATLGGAGHFSHLLSLLSSEGRILGIDADPAAIERAQAVYDADQRANRPTAYLVADNFRNLSHILKRFDIRAVHKCLFDLGWSGYQIATPRGFSFQGDEPLLMTYDTTTSGETAASLVNRLSEEELANLIFSYGEERFARSIARAIVAARAEERILTTGQLVRAIFNGVPRWYRERKIHPATKTFQALRIATNDEIGALQEGLTAALRALAPAGRLAVISFHSIEDRVVKEFFRNAVASGTAALVHSRPIAPGRVELLRNRRARSAKLRVLERTAALITPMPSEVTFSYA